MHPYMHKCTLNLVFVMTITGDAYTFILTYFANIELFLESTRIYNWHVCHRLFSKLIVD